MNDSPFVPGTFWEIDGRRYAIDTARRWMRVDQVVFGRIPPLTPKTDGAVQLHLVPIDQAPPVPERPAPLPDPVVTDTDREPRPLGWLFNKGVRADG
jgi:hypothetical protein